jgi:hypothetical protein
MKRWAGNEDFGNENVPWNVMTIETLSKVLTDRGSLPTPLGATELAQLGDENNTVLLSVLDDSATSSYTNREYVFVECDMASILAIYGATVFLGSQYKFDYREETNRWHKVRRIAGLYKNNTGGDNASVQLNSLPSLIDDDFSSAAISSISDKDINIGIQVGTSEFGIEYYGSIDALMLVASQSLATFSIYKSNDNRNWEVVEKSTYSEGTWNQGEKTVPNVRGSGSGYIGKLVLFAEPQQALYYKMVSDTAPGTPYNIFEIYGLNLQGELRYTGDLTNWYHAQRNVDFTDFLLFKFLTSVNEIRAFDYTVDPFDPTTNKLARIDLDHIEAYADTEAVDFGEDGEARIITITDGELGQIGDAQEVIIKNGDVFGREATKGYAFLSLAPRNIAGLTVPTGVTTMQLSDADRRVDYCRYILNAANTDKGSFGDSSVSFGGTMSAWTEVASSPGASQFSVDYDTGEVTFGSSTPSGGTTDFDYASPGAAAIEISANGVTDWKGPGELNRITLLSTSIPAGTTTNMFARANLTYFTEPEEDVIRTALLLVQLAFKGAKE